MSSFSLEEMLEMQKALQEKYKGRWEPICRETGQNKLLWMIGETGEVIDIIKKHGAQKACDDSQLRQALAEELSDVLMHFCDVLLCYDISAEELRQAYIAKFSKNMTRW